ncbi:MAG: symmetrical bis(5'-nucleosyl)-tetraphosphatase [Burkholderiales bacterium]|nr:symmetrical bis(5'-nucleosyl)-tetraphosphatase [Burkholderiales bacterium]
MSTYAIGDIQGCFEALNLLLEKIHFDPAQDRLWLVGDLINRGPDSVEVLHWAMGLGDRAVTVLGNHDLHFLAVAEGHVPPHRHDTLDELLAAPDRDELVDWLRCQRMIHAEGGWLLVHAGLLPQWTVEQALRLGGEVEAALSGDDYRDFLKHMYGNQPDHWEDSLTGIDRLRVITNAMTRLRVCSPAGVMDFNYKGSPETRPKGTLPWYEVPGRKSANANIVFGHWSALGLKVGSRHVALDTGCLWGGRLSALRLEDRQVFQTPCAGLASSRRLQ